MGECARSRFSNNDMTTSRPKTRAQRLRLDAREANAIAPGKQPLSSMAPTLVLDRRGAGHSWPPAGPGGSRIITIVLQCFALIRLEHGPQPGLSVHSRPPHSSSGPIMLSHEQGLSPTSLLLLQKTWATCCSHHGRWALPFGDPAGRRSLGWRTPAAPEALAIGE